VKDYNGCSAGTSVITVTNIGAPTGNVTSTSNACNGASTGTASIVPVGGTSPLTYSWSPSGGTGSTASGLAAGTYTVTVKDVNGCILISSATLSDPPPINGNITVTNLLCNSSNAGKATMTASGGTGALSYSWSPLGGTGSTAINLSAGTYTCTVKDANACSISKQASITQPVAIVTNFTQINPSCFGSANGSATATVSGGVGAYVYSWSPTGGSTATGTGFSANTYTLAVTDANGCVSTFPVTLVNPPALASSISTSNVNCFGACTGTATAIPSGGTTSYIYSWSPISSLSATATNLCAGTYTCHITDANNCTTQALTTVTEPTALANTLTPTSTSCGGACDGDVTATASGGTPGYLYSWSIGGQPAPTAPNTLCPGTYTCTLTDAHACVLTSTTVVGSHASPTITGTVTAPFSGAINSGWAYLVQYDSVLKRQHVVDSVTITNGKYLFNTSIGGKLLVYAEANHTTYPNVIKSYSLHAVQWDSAAIVNAPCASIDTANIKMYECPPLSGNGSLAGTINKGIGYVARLTGQNPLPLGEPIPGLDVNLEQHPSGIIAHVTTDTSGNYHFGKLPAGKYTIWVDIPGLGMTSEYTRIITTNQMFVNLNYIVDSAHIRPDSTFANSVIQNSFVPQAIHVAPNPFKEQLSVNYTLSEPSDVTLELFNILGERVSIVTKNRQETGDHAYLINSGENNLSQGTYLLKMTFGGKVYTQKIVCLP
jgi:hypothetical protein